MKVAGSGLVAGALAKLGPAPAAAQPTTGKIWSAEYWAKKGDVSLYLFRKRAGAPVKGEPPRPVLFLVHGSSISSRPTFDLSVPGKGEYSLMNVFAGYGFDVWTMDHESYGRSARTEGNSDIRSGAEDLAAGSELVARETGQKKMHFIGESSGALRAAAFSVAHPERVDRLVEQVTGAVFFPFRPEIPYELVPADCVRVGSGEEGQQREATSLRPHTGKDARFAVNRESPEELQDPHAAPAGPE